MNFTSDEEKDNCIRTDNDKPWKEETKENRETRVDVAISSTIPIIFRSSYGEHNKHWNEPSNQVVNLLQRFSITVSSHNHLVEIEGDTETEPKLNVLSMMISLDL